MSVHKQFLPSRAECREYTLFIDRDGVINEPIIDDYAKKPDDLVFCVGSIEALRELKSIFKRVVLVTNQQGIHRKLMTERDLENVHLKMYNEMKKAGTSYFDAAFFAPYLKTDEHLWRKPSNGMLQKARSYFSDIDWSKSLMVGDSPGDMKLADSLGITKVRIKNDQFSFSNQDFAFDSLESFVTVLSK